MSPIPPHRFFPPSVRTTKDRSLPRMMSCGPLMSSLKCGKACLHEISYISSRESEPLSISSTSIL
jgi:hypothetical protein